MNRLQVVCFFVFPLLKAGYYDGKDIDVDKFIDISENIQDVLKRLKLGKEDLQEIDEGLLYIDNDGDNYRQGVSDANNTNKEIAKDLLDVIDILYEYTDIEEDNGIDQGLKETNRETNTRKKIEKEDNAGGETDINKNNEEDIEKTDDNLTDIEEKPNNNGFAKNLLDVIDILYEYTDIDESSKKYIEPTETYQDELFENSKTTAEKSDEEIKSDRDGNINENNDITKDIINVINILDKFTDESNETGIDSGLIDTDFDVEIANTINANRGTEEDIDISKDKKLGDPTLNETQRESRQDDDMCLPEIPESKKIYHRYLIKRFVLFINGVDTKNL